MAGVEKTGMGSHLNIEEVEGFHILINFHAKFRLYAKESCGDYKIK